MNLASKRRRNIFIIVCVGIAIAVQLSWSPACLWFAKHQVLKNYEHIPTEDLALLNNCVLSAQTKIIPPVEYAPDRISCELDGYHFSFPAAKYTHVETTSKRYAADKMYATEKLGVWCIGISPFVSEFTKPFKGKIASNEGIGGYFRSTDPYQILVDTFNATPKAVDDQKTISNLEKHVVLLTLKTALLKIGSDQLLMKFESDKGKGIISGDVSIGHSSVLLYLPETRDIVEFEMYRKRGAPKPQMEDVYQAIAELRVDKVKSTSQPASQPTSQSSH